MRIRASMRAVGLGLAALALACVVDEPSEEVPRQCDDEANRQIFDDRIAPLLTDSSRSACNDCHLAGVDLGLYSPDGDECRTMACMVDAGIVDLEHPDQSQVLDWIVRADPDSPLITPDVLAQERDGMLEWIEYQAACGASACPTFEDPCGKTETVGSCPPPPSGHDLPPNGFDDPGDCSDVTLEKAFGELVYAWRGRCYPCHFDSRPGAPDNAPRWIVDGECTSGSLATMRNVLDAGYVDVADPEQSLLLLKPLAESAGGVAHEGSDKFEDASDGAYADFVTWLELVARCSGS